LIARKGRMRRSTRNTIRKAAITAVAVALAIGVVAFVHTAIEKAEYNDRQNPDGEFGAVMFHEFPEYDRDLGVEALFVLLSAGSLVWILAPET
jgi:hypothetical protein